VYVINTTADNGTIVSTLTGNKPYYVSLDPSGNRLFVANYGANNIQVYDTGTLSLLKTIPTAMRPMSPLVSPDGTRLYYVTDGNSNLVIADAASYATIKTVRCGSGVRGIACSPDGTKVYVTNMYSNSVTVVNVAGDIGNVIATVSVGSYPYGLEQFAGFY
jgi:YVTN family beta-propeller protein